MAALVVSILCSAAISHFFKLADKRGHRVFGIFVVNYVVATATGLLRADLTHLSTQPPGSFILAVILGILYIAGFLSLRRGVETLGPSIAASLSRVAVVLPILGSLILFRETVGSLQAVGITLGIASLPLAGRRLPWKRQPHRTGDQGWIWGLLLFLIFGVNDFLLKVRLEHYPGSDAGVFFAILFGTALLGSIVLFVREGGRINWEEAALGAVVGVVNFSTAYFLSLALDVLPGVLTYTMSSLGIILVVSISSMVIWRERLGPHNYLFQLLSVAAIVLVNLGQ